MDAKEVSKCTLEATVVTGLEDSARDECQIKLSTRASVSRGRIVFDVPMDTVPQALLLRSVDNICAVVFRVPRFDLSVDKEDVFKRLHSLVDEVDWTDGLKVWRMVNEATTFTLQDLLTRRPQQPATDDSKTKCSANQPTAADDGTVISVSPNETVSGSECDHGDNDANLVGNGVLLDNVHNTDANSTEADSSKLTGESRSTDPSQVTATDSKSSTPIPGFRVTCNRTGQKHKFTSMEAAAEFGGAIYDYFNWRVDMKNFDIEVILNIEEDNLTVCIMLTKESLHKRNLRYFGPTALRATIAYNILRLCSIQPGDVVCDPMCGGGSLPIEASSCWPEAYHLCGDNHEAACHRTEQNILAVNTELNARNESALNVNLIRWDVGRLPLRDASVDVVVTDLPFGKRMGSKANNRQLYPKLLQELARICNPQNGRAILLTHDKVNLGKNVSRFRHLWRQARVIGVNIGGLPSCVFILRRTLNKV